MGTIYFIAICFGIPVASMTYFIYKRDGRLRLFLTGIAAFGVSQLLLRIPLLNLVSYHGWFVQMKYTMPVVTALFYGVSAGLFEEVGRYLGYRFVCHGRNSWKDGVALGLGHGGIEAVWVGIQGIGNLSIASQAGLAVSGFERMCTILVQVALSVLVIQTFRKKSLRYLLFAIAVHAAIDSPILFMPNVWIAEGYVLLWAILSVGYLWYMRKESRREKFV